MMSPAVSGAEGLAAFASGVWVAASNPPVAARKERRDRLMAAKSTTSRNCRPGRIVAYLKYDSGYRQGARMITSWRLLMAAALTATLGGGVAAAQNVMVRHAPPGETVETVLNATKVGTGTVDSTGEVIVPLSLSGINKTEIDANVFVDICDKLHRVIVVERNKLPDPQQPGCSRRDIAGLYWIRPINTLVVDVADQHPTLLLVRGSYNPSAPHTWNAAPRGFVPYAGGLLGWYRDAKNVNCGNAPNCS